MSYIADYFSDLSGEEKQEVRLALGNFLAEPANLFNAATVTSGFLSEANNAQPHAVYVYSDFIPVTAGQVLVSSRPMRFTTFFGEGQLFRSGGSNTSTSTIVVPDLVHFVRITMNGPDVPDFTLTEQGDAADLSPWHGKKWASFGDSITQQARWQPAVRDAFGLVWSNYGIGGTRISGADGNTSAMCQDTRINAIPTDRDMVTLQGGTNDWAQNVPLGDVTSTDPTTFNGALNTYAEKAYARWPLKRLCLATTPYGEQPNWQSRPGWTSPAHNSHGLTTNDYAEAIRAACKRHNFVCIDVAMNGGWGRYNIAAAMGRVEDNLHPLAGSLSAKGISIAYINAFKAIAPLE